MLVAMTEMIQVNDVGAEMMQRETSAAKQLPITKVTRLNLDQGNWPNNSNKPDSPGIWSQIQFNLVISSK